MAMFKITSGAIIANNANRALYKRFCLQDAFLLGMGICSVLQTHKNIVTRQLYSRLAVPRPLGSAIQP
jgi:hypothetical protein